MDYKFPRNVRLTNEAQFRQVINNKQQKIVTAIGTIYSCYNDGNYPRLGVIVPKKQISKASQRNLLKRVVREGFRLNQYKLKNIDVVVVVNRRAGELPRKELTMLLDKQFSQLALC